MTLSIGPLPTPSVPQGVSYTPQQQSGSIIQDIQPQYYQIPGSTQWNDAWTQGYNSANSTSNPYSGKVIDGYDLGAGYLKGQQDYFSQKGSATVINSNPQPSNSGTYNFNISDFPNYTGWNRDVAYQDWLAKGKPSPSSNTGGGDLYASVRNDINQGYDSYFSHLDNILNNDLPTQYQNQRQIIENSYQSGVNSYRSQEAMGLSDLQAERDSANKNQAKNLKDLSENIRNLFSTGQNLLGARGAGDSSAVNQYSYALTKMGNKARGDVMTNTSNIQAEIGRREYKLKQTVADEIRNLDTTRQNKFLEVANWLSGQQSQIRQMQAQGQLSRGTDLANLSKSLLDQALSRVNTINQEIANRKLMLDQWGMNQSKTIAELKTNMANVSAYKASLPSVASFGGTPTFSGGNLNVPINWSSNLYSQDEDKYKSIY